ncbi:MAG: hypothetical protein AAF226_06240, partial [Verrucomicrobiota bacterium]
MSKKESKSKASGPQQVTAATSAKTYHKLTILSFMGDFLVVCLSLAAGFALRFKSGWFQFGIIDEQGINFLNYTGHFLVGAILMMLVLTNFRIYTREMLLSFNKALQILVKSCIVWFIAYLCLSLVLKFDPAISRVYCLIALGFMITGLTAWRLILNRFTHRDRIVQCLRQRAIVVGWSKDFETSMVALGAQQDRPFDIVGVIEPPCGNFTDTPPTSIPVLSTFEHAEPLIKMKVGQ